jgi:hypothetical protein
MFMYIMLFKTRRFKISTNMFNKYLLSQFVGVVV